MERDNKEENEEESYMEFPLKIFGIKANFWMKKFDFLLNKKKLNSLAGNQNLH